MTTRPPKSSTQAFMQGLIDYAGTFPPAALSEDEAMRRYAAYRKSDDAWMLGRYVCPAARFTQLDAYQELFSERSPLELCALGEKSPHLSAKNLIVSLKATLNHIETFREKWGKLGHIKNIELLLPIEILESTTTNAAMMSDLTQLLFPHMQIAVEFPFDEVWSKRLDNMLDACKKYNLCFKLRTGGVVADVFPTPDQIAAVIIGCRDREIKMKCTAGLHHPLRHFAQDLGTDMHGFVNVFAAGILAHVHKLDLAVTTSILKETAAINFRFDAKGLSWSDLTATADAVAKARRELMLSFGSCSFDEPREEMHKLGWL